MLDSNSPRSARRAQAAAGSRRRSRKELPLEGPSIRSFPRIELQTAVELRRGEHTVRIGKPVGNLSLGGLFIQCEAFPENAAVQVRFLAPEPFEVEGWVRYVPPEANGMGIEFTDLSPADRARLQGLIAELTRRGARPA